MTDAPDTWKWKRLRNFGFSMGLNPLEWRLTFWRDDNFYGGRRGAVIGPLALTLHYSAMDGAAAWLFGPHCEMDVKP